MIPNNPKHLEKMREINRRTKIVEPDLGPAVRKERDRCCCDALHRLEELGCVSNKENTG